MSVNRGSQKRPGGGYSVLFGTSAATAEDIGQRYMEGTRCTSLVIKVGWCTFNRVETSVESAWCLVLKL